MSLWLCLTRISDAVHRPAFRIVVYNKDMKNLYQSDLAYIHAVGFGFLSRGAAPGIVRLLKNASIPIRRVIDVGCGAGLLTKALVDEGFELTAMDTSPEFLEIASTVCPAAHFIHASAYDAQLPDCEAIIAIGESLTYHDRADADDLVRQFFRQVSSVLPSGGMLIFDAIELGEPSLAGPSWYSGEDWAVYIETTESISERILVRKIETFRRIGEYYRRGSEVHRVRLFDTQALCEELASCGFAVETARSYGDQQLAPRRRAFIATRMVAASPD
jgi:SAM-dependent methyltransferase